MSTFSCNYFHDTRTEVVLEDGSIVFPVGIHYTIDGKQRSRITGPLLSIKEFKLAKLNKATSEDNIRAEGINSITIAKIKMETAKKRGKQILNAIPPAILSPYTASDAIDAAKKDNKFILSEPELEFNAQQIVSQVPSIIAAATETATAPIFQSPLQIVPKPKENVPLPGVINLQPTAAPQSSEIPIFMQDMLRNANPEDMPKIQQMIQLYMANQYNNNSQSNAAVSQYNVNNNSQVMMMGHAAMAQHALVTMTDVNEDGEIIFGADQFNPRGNFLDYMMETMDDEIGEGTETGYRNAKLTLIRFYKSIKKLQYINITPIKRVEYIPFHLITVKMLKKMERWMEEGGSIKTNEEGLPEKMSLHTVRTYMCFIKAGFSRAEKNGIITKKFNPFGKDKYILPIPPKRDISIEPEMLTELYKYTPSKKVNMGGGSEEMFMDFWTMSLLAYGMNIIDLLKLKPEQIEEKWFEFSRSKTLKSRRNKEKVRVILTPILRKLMDKWALKYKPEGYEFLFPHLILTEDEQLDLEEAQEGIKDEAVRAKVKRKMLRAIYTRKVNAFTQKMNRYMSKIAEKLKFQRRITTYAARHTFANQALKSGMNPLTLMLKLGQGSLQALLHYVNGPTTEMELKVVANIVEMMQHEANNTSHKQAA